MPASRFYGYLLCTVGISGMLLFGSCAVTGIIGPLALIDSIPDVGELIGLLMSAIIMALISGPFVWIFYRCFKGGLEELAEAKSDADNEEK